MPLMHQPILAAREFILASLLGAAASCLALVAGMFLGFGETGLSICFAALTILIVLYVAAAPPPIAIANLRPLPPSLAHRRLLGHPLIADYSQTVWLSDGYLLESMTFMEEAERSNALLAMADACYDNEAPFWNPPRALVDASLDALPAGPEGMLGSARRRR